MTQRRFIPLEGYAQLSDEDMITGSTTLRQALSKRRTVRDFDPAAIPATVIENAIGTAASAPSGANLQPWHFVVVTEAETKHRIRVAAEAEEREFYQHRAPTEWLDALAPFGTDANKPFLETAPVLIAIFLERYGLGREGKRSKALLSSESVGIATGFLIAALHQVGLATLTHTPSPWGSLTKFWIGRKTNALICYWWWAIRRRGRGYRTSSARASATSQRSASRYSATRGRCR